MDAIALSALILNSKANPAVRGTRRRPLLKFPFEKIYLAVIPPF